MPNFPLPNFPKRTSSYVALLAAAVLPLTLAACTDNNAAAAAGPIKVTSTADACTLSTQTAKSGNITFAIQNDGNQVTEFYLLAEDGLRIVAEVENIGPGLTRNLVVTAPAGNYTTACKPGMQGDGIRAGFEVTESGDKPAVDTNLKALTDQGTAQYAAYVKDQTEQLVAGTKEFADGLRRRRRRQGPWALRRNPHALGADRARGRILRRPRPEAGRPRSRPGTGRGMDRLAPGREGPVPAGRLHRPDRRRTRKHWHAAGCRHRGPRHSAPGPLN